MRRECSRPSPKLLKIPEFENAAMVDDAEIVVVAAGAEVVDVVIVVLTLQLV